MKKIFETNNKTISVWLAPTSSIYSKYYIHQNSIQYGCSSLESVIKILKLWHINTYKLDQLLLLV